MVGVTRSLLALLMISVLAGCAAPASREFVADPGVAARCLRVIDGDTIELDDHQRVRLLCVNTPERGAAGFAEAREFLRAKIEGRAISLEADPAMLDRDRFGRLLRYVWCDGELVNVSIVRAGHSEYWIKFGRSGLHEAAFARVP